MFLPGLINSVEVPLKPQVKSLFVWMSTADSSPRRSFAAVQKAPRGAKDTISGKGNRVGALCRKRSFSCDHKVTDYMLPGSNASTAWIGLTNWHCMTSCPPPLSVIKSEISLSKYRVTIQLPQGQFLPANPSLEGEGDLELQPHS